MTYSLASAGVAQLANCVSCGHGESGPVDIDTMMHEISSGIQELEDRFPDLGVNSCEEERHLHSHAAHVLIQVMAFKLWLYLHYPTYARFSAFRMTPQENSRVFTLATSTLFLLDQLGGDPKLSRFSWFFSMFVPWHPLTVGMSKMCSHPDGAMTRKTWPLIQRTYEKCKVATADGSSGSLWRPIQHLFERVKMNMSIPQTIALTSSFSMYGAALGEESIAERRNDKNQQLVRQRGEELDDSDWSFDTPCSFL